MTNFLIGRAYRDYLSAMGFCVEQVLKKAGLPEDLFARQAPCLGAEEYFRFLQAIEALSPDKDAPVRLASSGLVSQISPPVFAASCSPDARTCLRRLAQYKPLIGALLYRVEETETELSVELVSARAGLELPEILVGIEFVFPRRADPQGDAGAGHAAVRCSKAAGEESRLRGVSRHAHHTGRAGPARFSRRFPRGRARPSAKAVSRVSDGFAVRRVGTLNQAFGR